MRSFLLIIAFELITYILAETLLEMLFFSDLDDDELEKEKRAATHGTHRGGEDGEDSRNETNGWWTCC